MRIAIRTFSLTAAALVLFPSNGYAGDRSPAAASDPCSSQANFYADAMFSFQMQHRAATEAAIAAKQPAPMFDLDRAMAATLSQTPARGLPRSWRERAVQAVYTQPQFVVWSPELASRVLYDACLEAARRRSSAQKR